jgi:hypothetical protein
VIAEAAAADRARDVRVEARAWCRSGIIDESTYGAILESYPDDRSRVGGAFRALLFLFTAVAVVSLFGALAVAELPMGLLLALTAAGCAAATEIQMGKLRRARSGSEEATALLAVVFAAAVAGWLLDGIGGDSDLRVVAAVAAVASLLGVSRWGVPLLGALASAFAFLALVWWSGARIGWIVLAVLLVPPLLRGSVSPALAPSQRRACDAALVTALLALYVALHVGSFDARLLETELLFGTTDEAPAWLGRPIFVLATALVPALVLLAGIRWKRPILLRSGLALSVASLVTLRFYVHVAPLWVVLVVSGGVALALAMLVHRYLASGPGKERHGFTAEPVLDRRDAAAALELGMTASLAPAAPAASESPRFRGGGGEFGGGGASGSF